MQPNTEITGKDDGIEVTITGEFDSVDGWPEAREDLGLNPAGDALDGVEIVDETPEFRDPGDDYPAYYSEVVLRFENAEALERANEHLYDQATERFEWGMGREAEKVQDFAGALPRPAQI